jgi:para-aminobenzoate synthetase component 2
MILVLDNYDSFVHTVARYLRELGQEVSVVRNDAVDVATLRARLPAALVLSPGPCTPNEAGVSLALVRELSGLLPILGICLGHQVVGQAFGARVGRAKRPLHGEASTILHDGSELFEGLPAPLRAGRYHSLIVEIDDATGPLAVTARSEENEIMALAHREHPTFGVQFHPESVLTQGGHRLLSNFLRRIGRP